MPEIQRRKEILQLETAINSEFANPSQSDVR